MLFVSAELLLSVLEDVPGLPGLSALLSEDGVTLPVLSGLEAETESPAPGLAAPLPAAAV